VTTPGRVEIKKGMREEKIGKRGKGGRDGRKGKGCGAPIEVFKSRRLWA